MASTTCVHCGNRVSVTFFPRAGRWDDPLLSWIGDPGLRGWISGQQGMVQGIISCIDAVMTLRHEDGIREKWRIGRCEECQKPLFVVMDDGENEIKRVFPPVSLERPQDIPSGVADDFVEGNLCLSVGAYKAAVSLCRRSLQAAALNKKCKKSDRLMHQLDELGDRGDLNASLLAAAHQIRHFGNYGSHPNGDGLGDISEEEAAAVRDLTWQVLEDLYVNPAKVEAVKKALAAKRGDAPRMTPTPNGRRRKALLADAIALYWGRRRQAEACPTEIAEGHLT